MIEKARKLGIRNIAIHKGLPFGPQSYEHSTCVDIGRVAKRYPDVNFLIYHSGFVAGKPEGPYDPQRTDGIDALVTSLLDNGIKPGSNVYAELGSTWRFLMRDPDSAAHALGKLFKHVRRGQRAVGHRLDLVRLAAGPDPGVPHVPDRRRAARASTATRRSRRRCARRCSASTRSRVYTMPDDVLKKHLPQRPRGAGARSEYRERAGPDVRHLRPEDAARVPESQGLGRIELIAFRNRLSGAGAFRRLFPCPGDALLDWPRPVAGGSCGSRQRGTIVISQRGKI